MQIMLENSILPKNKILIIQKKICSNQVWGLLSSLLRLEIIEKNLLKKKGKKKKEEA